MSANQNHKRQMELLQRLAHRAGYRIDTEIDSKKSTNRWTFKPLLAEASLSIKATRKFGAEAS